MGNIALLDRIRQNHALEHATMHVLGELPKPLRLMGRSDWNGFTLYGDVDTQDVVRASEEAVARLREGDWRMAVHPNCGTNLAVGGVLASTVAYTTAVSIHGSRLGRAAAVVAAMVAAFAIARPLGLAVQQYVTTTCVLDGVRIRVLRREPKGRLVVHRVAVEHGV
jgi:hypothetical protein